MRMHTGLFYQVLLGLFCVWGSVSSSFAKELIANGVWYEHVVCSNPLALSMYLLEVDPHKASIICKAAKGQCVSAAKTSDIAKRTDAVAAINGGFFSFGANKLTEIWLKILDCFDIVLYDAYPVWHLKIDGIWFSSTQKPRDAIGWRDGGKEVLFGTFFVEWLLNIGGKIYRVDHLNQPRGALQAVLYSPVFNASTLTNHNGSEIVIVNGKIKSVCRGLGDAEIPENGLIYSIDNQLEIDLSSIKEGMDVEITCKLNADSPEDETVWKHMDFIVGSWRLLLQQGKICSDIPRTERHPRTAVGVLANGNWLFVIVDGRQKASMGMTLLELALLMHDAGCIAALNLDGGGSSTLVACGEVKNVPSGHEFDILPGKKAERHVSDSFLVLSSNAE